MIAIVGIAHHKLFKNTRKDGFSFVFIVNLLVKDGRNHMLISRGLTWQTHLQIDCQVPALAITSLPFEVGAHFQSLSHSHINCKVSLVFGELHFGLKFV